MFSQVVSAGSVFAAAALFIAGQMLLGTNLSLRLNAEGYSTALIGLVMIHYAFGFVLGSIVGPRVIGRVGHIRAFSAFAAVTCCAALMHGALLEAWVWALLRAVSGFCGALLMIVLESWISAHARAATRGRLMSFYMINYYVAGSLGQLLVGASEPTDYQPYSLAAGLLVLALVPLALGRQPEPALPRAGRLRVAALFRASPIAVLGAVASGVALSSFYQLAPIYVAGLGESTATVARYMASAVLASMVFQLPFGWLADRYDRRRVILWIALAIGLASVSVASFGGLSLGALFIASMLFTGMASSLYPACVARLNERTKDRDQVAANASLLLCYGVGQCTGPLFSAQVMNLAGPSGLYLAVGLVLFGFSGFACWRLRRIDARVSQRVPITPVAVDATPLAPALKAANTPLPPPASPAPADTEAQPGRQ